MHDCLSDDRGDSVFTSTRMNDYLRGGYPVQRLLSGSIETDAYKYHTLVSRTHVCSAHSLSHIHSHTRLKYVKNTQAANMYLPACARCGGSYGCWPV